MCVRRITPQHPPPPPSSSSSSPQSPCPHPPPVPPVPHTCSNSSCTFPSKEFAPAVVSDVAMLAIRASEEESVEMEEMDTSEPNWCWFYLAECGVWHMFEVRVTGRDGTGRDGRGPGSTGHHSNFISDKRHIELNSRSVDCRRSVHRREAVKSNISCLPLNTSTAID